MTPSVCGISNASERGIKAALLHKRACWLHTAYCLGGGGGGQSLRARDKGSGGPLVGKLATYPLLFGGFSTIQGGQW